MTEGQALHQLLAQRGVQLGFDATGCPELIGRNGVTCCYSSFTFCPAVGFGPRANGIMVRRCRDGAAEVLIDGTRYRLDVESRSPRLEIPR